MAYEIQGTNSSYGQTATVKPVTAMAAIESFDAVLSRLEELASRVYGCADRIAGSRPSQVSAEKDIPIPQHLISQIQSRRDRLARVADHLESEVIRIESNLS